MPVNQGSSQVPSERCVCASQAMPRSVAGLSRSPAASRATATNFGKNRMGNPAGGGPSANYAEGDTPEFVAGLILRAITDGEAQIVAVRQGIGMTALPCFIGDADRLLVRAPGTDLHMHGTLWLLTQGETRKTKRVRLFTEFVSRRLAAYAPLLAGLSISRD